MRTLLILSAFALAACAAAEPSGVAKVDAAYLTYGGDGSDWAAVGYNYDEQRFSPLTQINDANVAQLGIAWFANLPDARAQEATPIVIDGTLFVTGPWSKVFAYEAATGRKLWEFDPAVAKSKGVEACCDVPNRGVAAWKGKLYLGTIDGRLIALDARTGAQAGLVYIPANDIGFAYLPPLAPEDAKRQPIGFNTGGNMSEGTLPNDPAIVKAAIAASGLGEGKRGSAGAIVCLLFEHPAL